MTAERWNQIKQIFEEVHNRPNDRTTFLRELSVVDSSLFEQVNQLLLEDRKAGQFLQNPLGILGLAHRLAECGGRTFRVGDSLANRFRITEFIAHGGMGEVYEALQAKPARKVALKVIKRGMDTKDVLGRFEAERQALALMNHPNVATIFDAGATDDGTPYFAMEYVTGVPVNEFCDSNSLPVRQRLELYLRVCAGVQHAHQKGIIHRDLKPSNILVTTTNGGEPEPKIIDFGVAKAMVPTLVDSGSSLTLPGQLIVGTLSYMSPEQVDCTNSDIDTRADVYSLGIILFELLLGRPPLEIEVENHREPVGLATTLDRIRNLQAPKPSAVLGANPQRANEAARTRRTTVAALRKQLRGDLDWIVLKALDKDRSRRYNSVVELAADVSRHMRQEPVAAGPPTLQYRASKFIQRNSLAVAAVATIATLLLAFGVDRTIQSSQIAKERDKAQETSKFLVSLFEVADPETSRGRPVTVREIVDIGAQKIRTELATEPEVRASMMNTLGTVYRRLGLLAPAGDMLRDALAIRRTRLGMHVDTAESLEEVASLLQDSGDYKSAESTCLEALEMRRKLLDPNHPSVASSMANLALILDDEGRYEESELLNRQALAIRRRVLGSDHRDTLQSVNNLAITLSQKSLYNDAEKLHREALAARRRIHGDAHPLVASSMNNLAMVLLSVKNYDDAEELLRKALEIRLKVLGESHVDVAITLNNLGMALFRKGDNTQAEETFRRALSITRRVVGEQHPDVAMNLNNIAYVLAVRGKLSESEDMYKKSLRIRTQALGSEHALVGLTTMNLADVVGRAGKWNSAASLYDTAYRIYTKAFGQKHIKTAVAKARYGMSLSALGRYSEAESNLLSALQTLQTAGESANDDTRGVLQYLTSLYDHWKRPHEAARYRARLDRQ